MQAKFAKRTPLGAAPVERVNFIQELQVAASVQGPPDAA